MSEKPVPSEEEPNQEFNHLVDKGYNDLYFAMMDKFARSCMCVEAISVFKQAEMLLPQDINDTIDLYGFTALAYALDENYDEALNYVNKARDICNASIPGLVAELLIYIDAHKFIRSRHVENPEQIIKLARDLCEIFEIEYLDILTDPNNKTGLLDNPNYSSMVFDASMIYEVISLMDDKFLDITGLCDTLLRAPWDYIDANDFDEKDLQATRRLVNHLMSEIYHTLAGNK